MVTKLVIGYGNTLRCDDGFGPAVIAELTARGNVAGVQYLEKQLLTVDLVEELEQVSFCVFVDAATTGDIGALVEKWVEPNDEEITVLGHDLTPSALLALARKLSGKIPTCVLLSTRLLNAELGEILSPEVAALVPKTAARVLELVR